MLIAFLSAVVFIHFFYFWALLKKDFSIIDVGWSLGFIVMSLAVIINYSSINIPSLILVSLILIWGLRLAYYLLIRNLKKNEEDPRYTKMRLNWGKNANLIAYPKIFLLQATLMFLIMLPQISFFQTNPKEIHWSFYIGVFIWLIGFYFEVVGDKDQNDFKKDPKNKGQFCNVGLWKYTRHPNYFGEVVLWWGAFIFVAPFVPVWTIVGPVLLTFLLLKVSGIPMHEERYAHRADYQAYQKVTNAFFPGPQKIKAP
jgi:steroid 5-alpha reductase family enzyme